MTATERLNLIASRIVTADGTDYAVTGAQGRVIVWSKDYAWMVGRIHDLEKLHRAIKDEMLGEDFVHMRQTLDCLLQLWEG